VRNQARHDCREAAILTANLHKNHDLYGNSTKKIIFSISLWVFFPFIFVKSLKSETAFFGRRFRLRENAVFA